MVGRYARIRARPPHVRAVLTPHSRRVCGDAGQSTAAKSWSGLRRGDAARDGRADAGGRNGGLGDGADRVAAQPPVRAGLRRRARRQCAGGPGIRGLDPDGGSARGARHHRDDRPTVRVQSRQTERIQAGTTRRANGARARGAADTRAEALARASAAITAAEAATHAGGARQVDADAGPAQPSRRSAERAALSARGRRLRQGRTVEAVAGRQGQVSRSLGPRDAEG